MKRTSRPTSTTTRKAAGGGAGPSDHNLEKPPPSPPPTVLGTRSSSPEGIGFKMDRTTGKLMVKCRAWVAIDSKFTESMDPGTILAEIKARLRAGEEMAFRDSEDRDAKLIFPIWKDIIGDYSEEEDETPSPSGSKKRKESKPSKSKSHE